MRRFIAIFTVVLFAGVCLVCGYIIGSEGVFASGKDASFADIDPSLGEVEDTIIKNFYHDVSREDMITGMLRGLAFATDDQYSMYMTAEEYDAYQESSSGTYPGVGVLLGFTEDGRSAMIKEVYDGGSAKEQGMQVGDIIKTADGEDVSSITELAEVSSKLRGPEGTKVSCTVSRDGQVISFELERRPIKVYYVDSRMVDNDLAYIHLKEFSGDCVADFELALENLQKEGAKGLILDLRDNPGGYVRDSVNIADMLLPKGLIVYTEDKNGQRQEYSSGPSQIEIPMVVLINENSASASEILAGAIQDYEAADLIGMKSFGKGIVQKPFNIKSTGGALMLTISTYYTPNGRSIHKEGLTPDHEVQLPDDVLNGDIEMTDENDTQLKKGIEVLRQKIGSGIVEDDMAA